MDDMASVGLQVDSRDVRKASGDLDRFARSGDKAGRSAKQATGSFGGMARGAIRMAAGLGLAVSAAAALTSAFRGTQQYTVMTNSLRAIGMSGTEAAAALEQIGDIAARTRAPLEATAQLYQRISIAGRDLGASSSDVLRFTENVGLALAQVGGGGAAASGALLQLSQAMSGGIVRAEEFNSILEGAFPIAQAAANAIEGAAGSVGQLRNMVIAGEISSREFFEAVLSQSDALEDAFANTIPTISGAMQVFRDQMTLSLGSLDSMVGGSESFARTILLMAENLDVVGATLGVAVTAFGVKYVGALALSTLATFSLTGALALLKTALVTTGIGALIVGAGYLVAMFGRLVKAAGGFGEALNLLKDVALEVWDRIGLGVDFIAQSIAAMSASAQAFFIGAIRKMAGAFVEFTWTVADGLNSLFGTSLQGASAVITQELGLAQVAAEKLAAASTAAASAAKDGFSAPLESVQALRDAMAESETATEGATAEAEAMNAALEDIGDGTGGGSSAASKIDQEREAIDAVVDSLKDQIAAIGETSTARKTAQALRQAGVSLYSKEGQQIADLVEQYAEMQEAQRKSEEISRSLKDSILDFALEGTDALDGMTKAFQRMALEAALFGEGMMGNGGGGLLGGLVDSASGALSGLLGGSASAGPLAGQPIFDIASSFDGGGYTGSGARTGGLDGRGGFMAMMHPRERVYDESRGQSRGQQGGVVNNIKVIAPPGSEVSEERQQNSSGGEDLTVMIDRAVSSLARDPSSAISRTLGNSYGVGRQTRKR